MALLPGAAPSPDGTGAGVPVRHRHPGEASFGAALDGDTPRVVDVSAQPQPVGKRR